MQALDDNGNHLPTALFESYLAKFLVENKHFFEPVFTKINQAILGLITANQDNHVFNRLLFGAFSNLAASYPGLDDVNKLMANFNLEAHKCFHKQFFEAVYQQTVKKHKPEKRQRHLYSLSELCQFALLNNTASSKDFRKQLRPQHLFSNKNRSRKEVNVDIIFTHKFGIVSEQHTPVDLKHHYKAPFESIQCQFHRDERGWFSQWLRIRQLPFVSGPSGTIEILLSKLSEIIVLSVQELKCYLLGVAAANVARGHHSFAEVFIVVERLGFKINDCPNRLSFYEQFLTEEVLKSQQYKNFISQQTYFTAIQNQRENSELNPF